MTDTALSIPIPGHDLIPNGWWQSTVKPWADRQMEQAKIAETAANLAGLEAAWREMGLDAMELMKGRRYLELRWGELLGPGEKTRGERTDLSHASDMLEKDNRYRFRQLATVPELVVQQIAIAEKEEQITRAALLRLVAEYKREEIQSRKTEISPPSGKYRVIYADPPWTYEKGKKLSIWKYGDVYKEYPTMELDDICGLPIYNIAEDDSVLFLWATMPKLPEALSVVEAWGFQYKTGLIWDKVKHNYGFYFSMRHELLLVGGRGRSTPDIHKLHDSVIDIERSDRHSEKPHYFRQLIDQLYINGKRIELFHRGEKTDGWDIWGYETA